MVHPSFGAALGSRSIAIPRTVTPAILPGRWIVAALAFSMVVHVVLMRRAGLIIDPLAASCRPFYAVGALLIGLRIGLRRAATPLQRVVRDGAGYFGAFTLFVLVGATICYPIAAESRGYADAWLTRSDAAVGFDWITWYRAVATHPLLQKLGRFAYESIFVSPALILAHAALSGRRDRAHAFLLSFWLAATITLTTFWFMPAIGPFAYLWHAHVPYLPISELWQPQIIPALRAHTVHVIDLSQLRGLVSAPSFHAAAAILFIAAAWPLRPLRWSLLALNLAMLLSTPVEGTHYLTDVIMGMTVAVVALVTVVWVERRRLSHMSVNTHA